MIVMGTFSHVANPLDKFLNRFTCAPRPDPPPLSLSLSDYPFGVRRALIWFAATTAQTCARSYPSQPLM